MFMHCIQAVLSVCVGRKRCQQKFFGACSHSNSDHIYSIASLEKLTGAIPQRLSSQISNKFLPFCGLPLLLLATLSITSEAFANDSANITSVTATPGSYSVIGTVNCVADIANLPKDVRVVDWDNETNIVLHSSPDRHDSVEIAVKAGSRGPSGCFNASEKKYEVSFRTEPEVSKDALQKSFQVLMAAFVLAVLLESALPTLVAGTPHGSDPLSVAGCWNWLGGDGQGWATSMSVGPWLVVELRKYVQNNLTCYIMNLREGKIGDIKLIN